MVQADISNAPVNRPMCVETTAMGAAYLAGLAVGVWSDISDIADVRESDRVFTPQMDENEAKALHKKWLRAVERAAKWEE